MSRALPLQIAPGLAMPLDAITETLGYFGQKGSGKSSTAAVFVEQGVKAGGRFVIADPTGVWWGLMHDGLGPGLPGIVFGGEHADVPLEREAGHVVAEFVVQQYEYPVVVLDLKLMRKADRTHFMLAFLETLYHDNREALHVVLDEAWQFAPTRASEGGESISLLGAVEDVVALGRSRGLGITMIAQRFATLAANVREQIGTLGVHRLVGTLDRKALKGWIEAQGDPSREAEVLQTMAKLQTAQALFYSPAFLKFFGVVDVNAPQTFDSRATPKVGQRVRKPGKRAPVDLDTLRDKMAATIERQKASDPKELQKRVRELELDKAKDLAEIKRQQDLWTEQSGIIGELRERLEEPTEVVVKEPYPVVDEEKLAALVQVGVELRDGMAVLTGLGEKMAALGESVRASMVQPEKAVADAAVGAERRSGQDAVARPAARPVQQVRPADRASEGRNGAAAQPPRAPVAARDISVSRNGSEAGGDVEVTGPEQKILDALAWFEALGVMQPTRVQVGLISGYSANSGGFKNLLGKLKNEKLTLDRAPLVDYPTPGLVSLTVEGRALATDAGLPSTDEGVQSEILSRLNVPQAKILTVLIRAWPEALSREELGEATDYSVTSGGFKNLLGKLRTSALVSYPDKGHVRAEDVLFPMASTGNALR